MARTREARENGWHVEVTLRKKIEVPIELIYITSQRKEFSHRPLRSGIVGEENKEANVNMNSDVCWLVTCQNVLISFAFHHRTPEMEFSSFQIGIIFHNSLKARRNEEV